MQTATRPRSCCRCRYLFFGLSSFAAAGGPAVELAFAFAFWPLPLFSWLSFRSAEDLLLHLSLPLLFGLCRCLFGCHSAAQRRTCCCFCFLPLPLLLGRAGL